MTRLAPALRSERLRGGDARAVPARRQPLQLRQARAVARARPPAAPAAVAREPGPARQREGDPVRGAALPAADDLRVPARGGARSRRADGPAAAAEPSP